MTWVIGASQMFGDYGIVISDIQVTVGREQFDILRKAYPVGPSLIGGFAGSVQIGFQLLESVSEFMRLPPNTPTNISWHPSFVAENWSPIARSIFEVSPVEQQNLGSQFILVGPDPVEDVIPGRAQIYICKFSWPTFEPQITRGGNSAISIGSGAMVEAYTEGIRQVMDMQSGVLQAEFRNPGGWGTSMNIAITQLIQDIPIDGISQYIHIHHIERERFNLTTNNRAQFPSIDTPNQTPTIINMPNVAQNYDDLLRMLNHLGANSYIATC